jgi:hypothetical protein
VQPARYYPNAAADMDRFSFFIYVSVFIMLKHIAVTELCLGMYIHTFCGSWVDHAFWKPSFLLKSESELQRIIGSNVSELWIDTNKGVDTIVAQANEVSEESDTATQHLHRLQRALRRLEYPCRRK